MIQNCKLCHLMPLCSILFHSFEIHWGFLGLSGLARAFCDPAASWHAFSSACAPLHQEYHEKTWKNMKHHGNSTDIRMNYHETQACKHRSSDWEWLLHTFNPIRCSQSQKVQDSVTWLCKEAAKDLPENIQRNFHHLAFGTNITKLNCLIRLQWHRMAYLDELRSYGCAPPPPGHGPNDPNPLWCDAVTCREVQATKHQRRQSQPSPEVENCEKSKLRHPGQIFGPTELCIFFDIRLLDVVRMVWTCLKLFEYVWYWFMTDDVWCHDAESHAAGVELQQWPGKKCGSQPPSGNASSWTPRNPYTCRNQ